MTRYAFVRDSVGAVYAVGDLDPTFAAAYATAPDLVVDVGGATVQVGDGYNGAAFTGPVPQAVYDAVLADPDELAFVQRVRADFEAAEIAHGSSYLDALRAARPQVVAVRDGDPNPTITTLAEARTVILEHRAALLILANAFVELGKYLLRDSSEG